MLGSGTLSASNGANASSVTISVTTLAVGTHMLTDAYSGDTIFAVATGNVSHVVNKANTTTTLVATPNPSAFGAPATVAAPIAGFTGDVEFFDGATSLGRGTLTGGKATLSTMALTEGGHSIAATYQGEASYATSTSMGLTQTVGPGGGGAGSSGGGFDAGNNDVVQVPDAGCGCRLETQANATGAAGALFALAGVSLVVARRRRRG